MNEVPDKKEIRLRRCLEKHPEEEESYSRLGKHLFLARRYDPAAETYLQGLRAFPRSQKLLLNLGVVRAAQGRKEEAGDLFRQVLALDPNNAAAAERLERLTAF